MITVESIANATNRRSALNGVFGLSPQLRNPMKSSETPAVSTIPDNDTEIASITTNSLRGELADIQGALRQNSNFSSAVQNYRLLLAQLVEKREQIREQIKELARLESREKDRKAEQEAMQKKIAAFRKQINDIVNSTQFGGNKIFTAAGQDMAISVGNDVVINLPAKNFGVSPTDVDLSKDPDTLLEKIKSEIQAIMEYDSLLLEVEEKIASSTTLMVFELQDLLDVEEDATEDNMTLELVKSSMAQVLEDVHKALLSQANVSPATAAFLINTNRDAA